MKLPFRWIEVAVILMGLAGIILYYMQIDPMRLLLSASIAIMGVIQVIDFWRLHPEQRNTAEKIKAGLAALIAVTACFLPFTHNHLPAILLILLFISQQYAKPKKETQKQMP